MGSDVGAGRCRCSDLRACAGAMMRCETARCEMRDARCEMRDARCETARRRDGETARWPGASGGLSRSRRSQGRGSCDCRVDTSRSCRLRVVIAYPCKLASRRPADPQTRRPANRKSQIANRKSQIANRKSQIANRKNRVRNAFSHFARPPFICNPKPVTRRVALPSTADCRLPTADCRLPTADCPLPTADREPSIADRRPRTADRPSSPNAPARPHRDARNL
ncbi:Uncharacterised protein [Burkholderia pseudomallei]|nr:Uncharacterised protein [Burkholderia pseudomallei]VCG63923.1 Uncharacterised protein [Burkholderia pseudomallei]VCG72252.1 Uncharacterised protein [Burkholderia pseudomallei]